MRKRRHLPTRTAHESVFILAEGETELSYFKYLQQSIDNQSVRLNLKPEMPNSKKIKEQYAIVKSAADSKDHSKVFWVVDLDCILNDSKNPRKGEKSPLNQFLEYRDFFQSNKYKGTVETVINSPCIEFWFLLHVYQGFPSLTRCQEALKSLQSYVPDYTKNKITTISPHLQSGLQKAVSNSRSVLFDKENPHKALSEMYKFFDYISITSKSQNKI